MTLHYIQASFDIYGFIFILVAMAIFAAHWRSVECARDILDDARVGVWKRIFAFLIDMQFAVALILPFAVFPTLLIEYLATGEWQWSFERSDHYWYDIFSTALIAASFYGIYFYFRIHLKHEKQTIGQRMLGFALKPNVEKPQLFVRFLVAWFVGAWWFLWPWTLFKIRQDYIWDKYSQISARPIAK